MIDLEQTTLAWLFAYSAALGVLLGVIYDAIRFVKMLLGVDYGNTERERGRAKRAMLFIVTFVFDVAFWLVFAVLSVLLTYNVSGGVFRGMVYFGMILGGTCYYLTVGRLTLKIGIKISGFIKRAVAKLILLILVPLRVIFSLLFRLYYLTIGKVIGRIIYRRKKRRQKHSATSPSMEALLIERQEETENNVTKNRYEREGRISFGGRGK